MSATARPAATRFDGLWLPMVTPLRQARVDFPAAQRLARHYRDAGVSGLVLFGSTGEGNLLTLTEKIEMIQAIRDDTPALPIMLGAGGVDTGGVAAAIRRLDATHPAGYLVPPPYYLCPSQAGIIWHYRRIAWATDRPLVLYNIPKRTGVQMTVETMEALATCPTIVAVKECHPAVLQTLRRRGRITALCGEDKALLAHFSDGGLGAIPASAHVRPDLFVRMMRLAQTGQAEAARELHDALSPLVRLLFAEPNPAPVKKALALQGMIDDELRMPLTPASRALAARLRKVIARLPAPADTAACEQPRAAGYSAAASSVNI
uniref:4-hydroxy-tetrahydrodipicolinate synthase n=1 Tax=Bordetella sputigena TaxID=1416810 RepID=UPI0039F03B92